jgi:hypothetical protein
MKKSILPFLFAQCVFLFSFSANNITKPIIKVNLKNTPSFYKEGTAQKITILQLSGKYILKYANTLQSRTCVTATSVGLDFLPDTYLYSTGGLYFNATKLKVELSAVSSIAALPDSKYGSHPFKINGSRLTIVYNKNKNYEKFNVLCLKNSWLIMEDIRIKQRWAFYKK